MHLLAAKPGGFSDREGIVDLKQAPADIVILSAQDTSLSLLAKTIDQLPLDYPSIRLANLLYLSKPAAIDLYVDTVLQHSKLVIVSLLGGRAYWPYGMSCLEKLKLRNIVVAFLPGDDQADTELESSSNIAAEDLLRLWQYLREGGTENARNIFQFVRARFFQQTHPFAAVVDSHFDEPRVLAKTLVYHPQQTQASITHWQAQWTYRQDDNNQLNPIVAILFYRSHVQSGNTQAFNEFIECLIQAGLNPLPIATTSLKDTINFEIIDHLLLTSGVSVVINTTGFSVGVITQKTSAQSTKAQSTVNQSTQEKVEGLFAVDVPVIQAILAGSTEEDWRESTVGLSASDIAMNIALPEVDGRIISRAISFKNITRYSERSQSNIVEYALNHNRAMYVAHTARNWAILAQQRNSDKRVALILANYPVKEGRIGNGVGLDTPASMINILRALQAHDYVIDNIPSTGSELIERLLTGVTNDPDTRDARYCYQSLSIESYKQYFAGIPFSNQQAVFDKWGAIEDDPTIRSSRFMVPGIRLGEIFIGIQPPRGYEIDINATYHDPDLIPPHAYLAFYFWLRHEYKVSAVVHVGKHGNLEWLPGKGVALSENCWSEIALGPMPLLYPFIVNDPGEGAQAKRRAQAVIIDHLMPPMTRAETYGVLQELEKWVDEYYQAMGMDQRRTEYLRQQILTAIKQHNLQQELGLSVSAQDDEVLVELDTYLCDLKEAQIRDGLHILGESPVGEQYVDTLIALCRNMDCETGGALNILSAIARDFEFDASYDPLTADPAVEWRDKKPAALATLTTSLWRSQGDTRERLELFAITLVTDYVLGNHDLLNLQKELAMPCVNMNRTLDFIRQDLSPRLQQSGGAEIAALLKGLNGKFINPGPSGAPTRGRLDVLPTGRNFFSVDTRSVPTPTAWALGKISAEQVVQRFMQDNGDYPRRMGLSVWGTSTMRTGGDDIAQAMALMGVKPVWSTGNNRVIDVEIIPGFILGRPRVDVTLRISGFFRDAFPNLVKLYDTAVQALVDYEEPGNLNSIRHNVLMEMEALKNQGEETTQARTQAAWRIFGSKPGAYGAGLKGLIDQRCWQSEQDLAEAYLNWGGYAYSKELAGQEAKSTFRDRLASLQAVLQNQDNREHDILDSDDYYQFQGGMANAVRTYSGTTPSIYHGDHANPTAPKIRSLKQEIDRVVRSRVVNPKWISAAQRHGYKGAFEMSATVDYLFAYDATTNVVDDYQYAMLADSYLYNETNRDFLQEHNPNAMKEIAERLIEAMQRGLWQAPGEHQQRIESILLDVENSLETRQN